MIHFTEMGGLIKVGLNFYRTPGGFVAVWAWYDVATYRMIHSRIRLRLHKWPFILTGDPLGAGAQYRGGSVITGWLDSNEYVAVPRTLLEDEAPQILRLAQAYRDTGFPPDVDGVATDGSRYWKPGSGMTK